MYNVQIELLLPVYWLDNRLIYEQLSGHKQYNNLIIINNTCIINRRKIVN